jgi:hypothetical protein
MNVQETLLQLDEVGLKLAQARKACSTGPVQLEPGSAAQRQLEAARKCLIHASILVTEAQVQLSKA